MLTALIFIIVLAVLIFVHELGHFLAARACGIRVDAFKIGFGPKVFAWKRGETEYGVNIIPFGGYVSIHGENPNEEAVSGPDASRSFVNKARWKQVIVLAAGVIFNFIFAWILYSGGFMAGVTATPEGFERYTEHFSDQHVIVTLVNPGSPAEQAGLKVGDTILNSTDVDAIQNTIYTSEGKPVALQIERGGESQDITVTPVEGIVEDKFAIGIAMQSVVHMELPFFASIVEGGRYTWMMMRETTIGLGTFFGNIFRGQANFSDVAGPIGIAGIVGDAAQLGFNYLVMITALISINLGIINLVPFPALDGGRILFVLIESVIRRRISMKFTNAVNGVGFALLMLLMLVVTYKDLVKIFR